MVKILHSTRLLVRVTDADGLSNPEVHADTWGAFAWANMEVAREVFDVLKVGGRYVGGGGAAPVWTVEVVDAYPPRGRVRG